jgi:hypothetical protein
MFQSILDKLLFKNKKQNFRSDLAAELSRQWARPFSAFQAENGRHDAQHDDTHHNGIFVTLSINDT